VRELITTTINKSSDAINVKHNYANAFPCPKKEKQCYCIVNEEYKVANCSKCDSNDISKNDESYWCWFGLESDSIAAGIKDDALLNTTHLHDVRMLLRGVKSIDWFSFGFALGLYDKTLKRIEVDYPRSQDANKCVRECLVKWLEKADDVNDKGGANWSTLIKALEDNNQNTTADYISE
uniref:Death domain-containing protein n=1 Tax=Amphimedon queenslandica TaxID=400682 RepID=A0A1X7SMH4_AMPQE